MDRKKYILIRGRRKGHAYGWSQGGGRWRLKTPLTTENMALSKAAAAGLRFTLHNQHPVQPTCQTATTCLWWFFNIVMVGRINDLGHLRRGRDDEARHVCVTSFQRLQSRPKKKEWHTHTLLSGRQFKWTFFSFWWIAMSPSLTVWGLVSFVLGCLSGCVGRGSLLCYAAIVPQLNWPCIATSAVCATFH